MASILLLVLLLSLFTSLPSPFLVVSAEPAGDVRAALLEFMDVVPHATRIQWSFSTSACTWAGVKCDAGNNTLLSLRLPGVGLAGPIPAGTLGRLSGLRVLSLRHNGLTGPIPADIANLTFLHRLYLQHNDLTAGVPDGIGRLIGLTRLDISNNNLTSEVPFSLNNLTRLTGLFLEQNCFSGSLPDINIAGLIEFNASYNSLSGSVPVALRRFPASSFAGNLNLCQGPLPPCEASPPGPGTAPDEPVPLVPGGGNTATNNNKKKLSTGAIVAIAVAAGGLLLLLAVVLCWVCQRRRAKTVGEKEEAMAGPEDKTSPLSVSKEEKPAVAGSIFDMGGEQHRQVFVGKGGSSGFNLEGLLLASAEVLGKGRMGTSYKAVLKDGTTMAVKKLKDVVATRHKFDQLMEGLGRAEVQGHPNVLIIHAYYYSKEEKLIVSEYLAAGSLSSILHGSRGSGMVPLDWDSRMRIALAAGRGLAHLHDSAGVVHGNVKASNVLLRQDPEAAVLSDYGLNPVFGWRALPPTTRVAGYLAPEVVETLRPTYKSDVYSFGVLLLELLTGKPLDQLSITGEEQIELPRWVQSVGREEWTGEVFDGDMARYPNMEEEMLQLLHIAMTCINVVPDARPSAREMVRMMEDIVRLSEEGQLVYSDELPSIGTP